MKPWTIAWIAGVIGLLALGLFVALGGLGAVADLADGREAAARSAVVEEPSPLIWLSLTTSVLSFLTTLISLLIQVLRLSEHRKKG